MLTSLQDLLKNKATDPNIVALGEILFGNRKAKDIYRWMKFTYGDRSYNVWNVYVKYLPAEGSSNLTVPVVRINVGDVYFPGLGTAPAWFNAGVGIEWIKGSLGDGMHVVCPEGKIGKIEAIQPNGATHVLFEDGTHKSFREQDLREIVRSSS